MIACCRRLMGQNDSTVMCSVERRLNHNKSSMWCETDDDRKQSNTRVNIECMDGYFTVQDFLFFYFICKFLFIPFLLLVKQFNSATWCNTFCPLFRVWGQHRLYKNNRATRLWHHPLVCGLLFWSLEFGIMAVAILVFWSQKWLYLEKRLSCGEARDGSSL